MPRSIFSEGISRSSSWKKCRNKGFLKASVIGFDIFRIALIRTTAGPTLLTAVAIKLTLSPPGELSMPLTGWETTDSAGKVTATFFNC